MSSAELYCKGTRVWLPHKSQVWCPGVVVSPFHADQLVVEEEDGERRELVATSPADLPPLRNPDILVGANDLTTLSYLHEPAVLHNLNVRFLQSNTIYTYCGIVLVAVNPYQQLPIYGNEIINAYSGHQMGEMDPHIFAVAEEAYRRMAREGRNQSIVVSGESGAGKTVSAKYTMRYFATVGGASAETQIERKVLASNPIMEAIGNAKTTRNDNSSRFGKYIEIGFDTRHCITGAHMSTYLLEKSRVVCQCENERNYHIFYQLCASRDLPEFSELHLDPPEDFRYTNQGECVQIEDVDDQSDFSAIREALGMLGFHDNQQQYMFQVLAAILHLGNVEIGSDSQLADDESQIDAADPHLLTAASLLGVDGEQLRHWLANRKIVTARETLTTPLTLAQATNARDGLAKQLYSSLFQWVVGGINQALRSHSAQRMFIGVLDIYGFEVFQTNGFEQFCINYANEKLQQQFNMHVFKLEQQEYVKEAIEWSFIDFYDNQPCIDLVESRLGVLDLLDETCRLPKGCDKMFIQKLYQGHEGKGSAHFSKPRTSTSAFAIHHYAGCVEYEGCGFVEKNMDSVIEEHVALLRASKFELVSQLFHPGDKKSGKTSGKQRGKKGAGMIAKPTVGSQFRESLSDLMRTLNSTTPHYIRCIKPNDEKLPFVFEPQRAVQQLRACGVLETIRISAAGYPSRWLYRDFFDRYLLLLPSGQVRREDVRQMCEYILQKNIKDEDKYRFGKTKIFFRAGQVAYLERLRSQRLHACGVLIQKHIRGWLEKKRYQRLRRVAVQLQARTRGLLARRHATFLRRTRAAVLLQRNARCLVHRRCYLKLRLAATTLQSVFRGKLARTRFTRLLRNSKAGIIQRCMRGWLARQAYRKALRDIVTVQCCAKRWLARRELKRLKIEARSVNHMKNLNKGLEIKIIELQQKLSNQLSLTSQLESRLAGSASASKECECALEAARERVEEVEGLLAAEQGRSSTLEEQLNALREEREKEVANHCREVEGLQKQLQEATAAAQSSQNKDPESPLNTFPESNSKTGIDWKEVELELAHLRKHHQKTLHEFHSLEQYCAQLQKELQSLKHGSPDITNLTQITELFSNSILSPPYSRSQSQSQVSVNGKLHHSSSLPHLYLSSSTPGTHLGMGTGRIGLGPDYLSPDSSETPTTFTSEKETPTTLTSEKETPTTLTSEKEALVFSEMKQKVFELERERDSIRREKDALEKKMEGSGGMSVEHYQREVQVLERAKVSLSKEVARLKHAFQQSCSTTSLNVTLQEEVARLTEENLSLLESLEYLQHECKPRGGVARTPMSPRRRINPCGADSPKKTPVKFRGFDHLNEIEKPILGLLSWKPEDQSKVLKSLILELRPEGMHNYIPCLPAHMIFMCLCYPAYQNNELQLMQFIGGVVSTLQQVTQNHHGNLELLAFWLANVCRLMHNLRQYSEKQPSGRTSLTSHSSLAKFDLMEYREMLADRVMSLYQEIVAVIHSRLQPLIVPGLMEHEAIQGLSSSRPIGSRRMGSHDITVETVVKELSNILATLQKSCLDPQTLVHIVKQEYYMIAACMLNNLLLRRDMCHWSRGMQIRYNLSRLEEWCRDNEVCGISCSEVGGALEQLQPIIQAAKLLQMRKSRESDAEAISELCTHLNPLQVQKILTMYAPANEFEERVPVSVIRQAAKRSGADKADPSRLMADVNHVFPVTFPYTPSDVNFTSLTIPNSLKLNFLVRI